MTDGPYTDDQRNDWNGVQRVREKLADIPDLGGATYLPTAGNAGGDVPVRALVCAEDGSGVLLVTFFAQSVVEAPEDP